MAHTIQKHDDGTFTILNEGVTVEDNIQTLAEAEEALAEYEADDAELERTGFVNRLKPGSRALARAQANELAFDRQLAADAALGAKVLETRGHAAPWTAVEKRVAAADLKAAQPEPDANWQVEARKRIKAVDLSLDGHATPEAWLEAARKRCDAVEAEMRSGSSLPESHLLSVSSLSAVTTRSL